jgi:PPOX class probable F420-dependent enzyme
MFTERARTMIGGPHTAVLTTLNRDGSPHSSPVWFLFEELAGEAVVWVSVRSDRQKCANLARDPRASLVVVDPAAPQHYVEVRGEALVFDDPDYAVRDRVVRNYGLADGSSFDPPGTKRSAVRLSISRVLGR